MKKSNMILLRALSIIFIGILLLAINQDNLILNIGFVFCLLIGIVLVIKDWEIILMSSIKEEKINIHKMNYEVCKKPIEYKFDDIESYIKNHKYSIYKEIGKHIVIYKKNSKKYFILDQSNNLEYAYMKIYMYIDKYLKLKKNIEVVVISYFKEVDKQQIEMMKDLYKRHQLSIVDNQKFSDYLSEDGSSYDTSIIFSPALLDSQYLFYINNVRDISTFKKLSLFSEMK